MKKTIMILTLFVIAGSVFSQTPRTTRAARVSGVDVFYVSGKSAQDKKAEPVLELVIRGNQAALRDVAKNEEAHSSRPPVSSFMDFAKMEQYSTAVFPSGDTLTVKSPIIVDTLVSVGTESIAGWNCEHIRKSINSNTIDIWYTKNLGFRGTPIPGWGVPDGVVLKVMRNGNVMFEASRVQQATDSQQLLPSSWGKFVDGADFNYELNNSAVKTVQVFDHDRIAFVGGNAPANFNANELYAVGGGTVILKKVALPENADDYSIFAEVVQYSDGDAYDRTGSIFVIPTDKKQSFLDALSSKGLGSLPSFVSDTNNYPSIISTSDYTVPAELMRFFTSFGVRKFNHIKVKGQVWADSVIYKQDVSYLAPMLKDSAWIAAYIGNWDSKGHILSLKLKYYPEEDDQIVAKQVIPLFNTLNILEQAGQTYPTFFDKDSLRVTFTLDKPIENAHLVYITTGHGGWGGGDEFNQKVNTLYLDGEKVYTFIPWRGDCATYRNWNPCSGNFSNGLSSSDLSRSNWCPGTVTNPVYIPLGNLSAGTHTMSVQIPLGASEGSSFSYWCVSGVLIGK